MKYARFEDLPVWQAAIELAVKIYALTAHDEFKSHGSLRDQIERAAVSISNNVAEGFERGTTNELLHFLYIARGSAGEVRSMLHLFDRLPFLSKLKAEITALKPLAESISRQLRGWADSLQNSDIKGQRHLNDQARRDREQKMEQKKAREEWSQERELWKQQVERDYEERVRKQRQAKAEEDEL